MKWEAHRKVIAAKKWVSKYEKLITRGALVFSIGWNLIKPEMVKSQFEKRLKVKEVEVKNLRQEVSELRLLVNQDRGLMAANELLEARNSYLEMVIIMHYTLDDEELLKEVADSLVHN